MELFIKEIGVNFVSDIFNIALHVEFLIYMEDYLHDFKCVTLDNTVFADSGKVGIP